MYIALIYKLLFTLLVISSKLLLQLLFSACLLKVL